MGQAKRQTVLVVEDEFLIRTLIADQLRDAGIDVLEAVNADEALPLLLGDETIEILLTDVRMPGTMDGVTLARHARQRRPHMKVIVVSGHSSVPTDVADMFLRKPFDIGDVVSVVTEFFKH